MLTREFPSTDSFRLHVHTGQLPCSLGKPEYRLLLRYPRICFFIEGRAPMKFFDQLDSKWSQPSEAKACEHTVQYPTDVPYKDSGRMGLYLCADCRIEIIRP